MWLLQISIVIFQSLHDSKSTFLIKSLPILINHMHMQVDGNCFTVISHTFLQILHHLMPNTKFTIWLQHTDCQNIRVLLPFKLLLLAFVILNTNCVCPNYYIIVKTKLRMLSIFICYFLVKWSTVLHRKYLEIQLTEHVYIFRVYISICYFYIFAFAHLCYFMNDIQFIFIFIFTIIYTYIYTLMQNIISFYIQIINIDIQQIINKQVMRLGLPKLFQHFCTNANKPVSLKFDNDKNTAYIKLTNPKKRNTLSLQTIGLLKQSLNQIQAKVNQKKTRIAILQGEGTVFSSGHDLKQLSKLANPKQVFDACAQLMLKVHNMPIPIVCVVNGIAAAAGFQLAMACDILVATEKSTFSCPGVKWGLFCSTPAVQLVRKINSINKANQILYFGEEINAQQAYHYGIANKIVPEDKLQQTIQGYISKINHLSAQVVINGKKVLREQRKQNIQKAYDIAGMAMNKNIKEIQDCKEGLKAFAEKRHPHFKN